MSNIKIRKDLRRWLFGGLGFHNSEATMTPMMSDKFLNERVLKCFGETSPTFSRVFAGYFDWTREAMDRFADYYDKTFRKSGTLLYLVPGRMPMITDDFNLVDYCEKVATNLEYLIKERKCTKVRYYCATNELSVGNTYAYLAQHLDLFKEIHTELQKAFIRHGLDIGLMATDASGVQCFSHNQWVKDNMDEQTEVYCTHLYSIREDIDENFYDNLVKLFSEAVEIAQTKEKRFCLGEFGITSRTRYNNKGLAMRNDMCAAENFPEEAGVLSVKLSEMCAAIINTGVFSGAYWSLVDYPDPFIREDGDSDEEKAIYDVARFSGHGLPIRYNKNGLFRWCDDEQDYSSRAMLYTIGYMVKLFRKGSRTFAVECDDKNLRACAVTNPDGSFSCAVINIGNEATRVSLEIQHNLGKPMRKYDFEADNVPFNKFCDLQPFSALVEAKDGRCEIEAPPMSVTFLTTDYVDRKPSEIKNVRTEGDFVKWDSCEDAEHCYYRVYASDKKDFIPSYENQICSTVALYTEISQENAKKYYKVESVDKYGNR
ncbi:MAG: hypothetical protein IKU43_00135 [Clostridia bacterium]|nr:hypothetical protein [Clostridia bacterium]